MNIAIAVICFNYVNYNIYFSYRFHILSLHRFQIERITLETLKYIRYGEILVSVVFMLNVEVYLKGDRLCRQHLPRFSEKH